MEMGKEIFHKKEEKNSHLEENSQGGGQAPQRKTARVRPKEPLKETARERAQKPFSKEAIKKGGEFRKGREKESGRKGRKRKRKKEKRKKKKKEKVKRKT